ncbi:MAG: hypothetical protein KKC79_15615 [Gammaproteobacteria bacterium]|nr:hypothetical protein [Gammaproteobacteria bacterium]MBU1443244.1 hypothetical protein [Gammaproteobacteria bacterium]MBU2410064.1 hypothetical protein [Gammaproteobacteria bacterium]
MPIELLRQIAEQKLPLTIESPEDIDKLRVLRAAELLTVLITHPDSLSDPDSPASSGNPEREVAKVLSITPKGREALRDGSPPLA